ncbi:MAG: sigma-54-dependent Fis family transcriptional regulator [Gammaproteobacteria bacterium]|nr:sigma-54-dependent Fis family transcriptional regulator [Gammaproteobacteria bacterium]
MRAPHILVVDDEADIRSTIQDILTDEGYEVTTAANAEQARVAVSERTPQLVLLDIWMPDTDGISLLREWQQDHLVPCPVVILSGHGTVDTAVEATRLGAADFVEKPVSLNKLLRTVEQFLRGARPADPAGQHGTMLPPLFAAPLRSRRIRELRERAERLAPHAMPVMVVGERGSGREALAGFIHQSSPHRDGPFIRAPGATLIAESAAQLLLGTGSEPGFLERAAGGTLYLSSLEDLSDAAQSLLAGVLETGRYARVGESTQQALAARLITSLCPCTLADPAAAGVRPELVERLGALRIDVPSLREHAEDIPELLGYTAEALADREQLPFRRFSFAAQNRLRNYPWPGNLRELHGLVRRVLAAGGDEEVSLAEVEAELRPPRDGQEPLVKQDLLALPLREAREHFERAYLTEQLGLCGGKVSLLAKRVGMERTHLYRKLRSLGIDYRGMLGED